MPNQIPYGPFVPNMNMQGFDNNYNILYKIQELEQKISILENKVNELEQKLNNKNEYIYQTSMHMM